MRLLHVLAGVALLLGWATPAACADVSQVRNTTPAEPHTTVHLEEIWRIGGEDSDLIMGSITEAATDRDGNVYLLDTQLSHALVVSPEGELLRTIGREGEGPGETRQPRDIVYLPDSTIGFLELFPAKLVKLSPKGEARGMLVVGGEMRPKTGFVAASQFLSRAGIFVVAGQHAGRTETGQRRVMFLARLSATGEEVVRYREATLTLDFNNLKFVERELSPGFHLGSAVGPDGRVYTVQAWDRYAIEVFLPDGTLERVITREFENRMRTDDELRRINALYAASDQNIGAKIAREIEPSPPAISGLHVDPEGNLWVQHSRSGEHPPDGVMLTYDIFDPEGIYLREIAVACEGDADRDGLVFLDDGRVLLIKGYILAGMARTDLGNVPLGEEEHAPPPEIICCRMAR